MLLEIYILGVISSNDFRTASHISNIPRLRRKYTIVNFHFNLVSRACLVYGWTWNIALGSFSHMITKHSAIFSRSTCHRHEQNIKGVLDFSAS